MTAVDSANTRKTSTIFTCAGVAAWYERRKAVKTEDSVDIPGGLPATTMRVAACDRVADCTPLLVKRWWLRADVTPFVALYALVGGWAASHPDGPTASVAAALALALTLFAHAAVGLCEVWFVTFRAAVQYTRVRGWSRAPRPPSDRPLLALPTQAPGVTRATHVLVVASAHSGPSQLCTVQRVGKDGDPFFTFQGTKFVATPEEPDTFKPLPFPVRLPLEVYAQSTGLTGRAVAVAAARYGTNDADVPLPEFWTLFTEHAVAPFFVFQVCALSV